MIKEFKDKQFGNVRVVIIDGEPWFVGADFCKALNINKIHMRRLNDDNKKLYPMPLLFGVQQMIIVNAAGLDELILASDNTAAKNWIKHVVLLGEKNNSVALKPAAPNYAPNSLATQKGTLGERIVKRHLEENGFEVRKPEDTFKSGASIVDFAVSGNGLKFFAEVKVQSAFLYGVENAPCYSFPKSRIDAYTAYGKSHGKGVNMYVVDPVAAFVYFNDLFALESPRLIDARRFPFDKWNDKFGGFFHYWHREQFRYKFAVNNDDLADLRKLFGISSRQF